MINARTQRWSLAFFHQGDENIVVKELFELLQSRSVKDRKAAGHLGAAIRDLEYVDLDKRPFGFCGTQPIWLLENERYHTSLYVSTHMGFIGVIYGCRWNYNRAWSRRQSWKIVEQRMEHWFEAWLTSIEDDQRRMP